MNSVNLKSSTVDVKRFLFSFLILPFAFYLSACTAFDAGSNVQRGRYALLRGDSKVALQHFQRASEIDPQYFYRIGPMKEGVWTYVGRAHYSGGDYKAAQKALEFARTRHPDDSFAPLYLGLTLSKDGDRQRGAKELQTGLTGLNDWLEYIDQYTSDRAYWDPGAIIRSGIKKEIANINGKEVNWTEVIAGAERVGVDLETEADEARLQRRREQRDSAKGDGKGD
jgi:tetratricopeptide (TPR) repeat protein